MTTQEMVESIKSELNKISVRNGSGRSAQKIERKIQETAETLAAICIEKQLSVVKGSSSPSTQKSYQSLYLEYPGASHNVNHGAYANVIARYDWQTKSKYGFSPVPQGEFMLVCDSLVRKAKAAAPFNSN